ncbi:MAG: ABC transporter substrate-binding protein [Clostridium sp.]
MRKITKILALALCSIMLVSCTSQGSNSGKTEKEKRPDNEILIWSHFDGFDAAIKEFTEKNPEYTVKVETFEFNEYVQEYLKVLGTENEPDVMIIDSTNFGMFNTTNSFEDLLSDPYNIGKYKEDFDKEAWTIGMSFDDKKMISIPYASAPVVTFYRRDILEKNGITSDPEELGKLMEDPEEWLNIARKLRDFKEVSKTGSYITQWTADPVSIVTKALPKFDDKLNFGYTKIDKSNDSAEKDNRTRFTEAISAAKKIGEEYLVPRKDIWLPQGEEALRTGEIAMVYLGSWGAETIEQIVGESQMGLWGMTRLPFNTYGWSNCTMMSIPKNAQNKDGAWKFIEYFTFQREVNTIGSVPTYRPLRENQEALAYKNPFLKDQQVQRTIIDIMDKTEEYKVTALDEAVFDIWEQELNTGIEAGARPEDIVNNIEDRVREETQEDKKIILELMNDSNK